MTLTEDQKAIARGTLETVIAIISSRGHHFIGRETEKELEDAILATMAKQPRSLGAAAGLAQAKMIGSTLDKALADQAAVEADIKRIIEVATRWALKAIEAGGMAVIAAI